MYRRVSRQLQKDNKRSLSFRHTMSGKDSGYKLGFYALTRRLTLFLIFSSDSAYFSTVVRTFLSLPSLILSYSPTIARIFPHLHALLLAILALDFKIPLLIELYRPCIWTILRPSCADPSSACAARSTRNNALRVVTCPCAVRLRGDPSHCSVESR